MSDLATSLTRAAQYCYGSTQRVRQNVLAAQIDDRPAVNASVCRLCLQLSEIKISLVSANTTLGSSDAVVVRQRTCPSRTTSIFVVASILRTLFKRHGLAIVHMEGSKKYDADG